MTNKNCKPACDDAHILADKTTDSCSPASASLFACAKLVHSTTPKRKENVLYPVARTALFALDPEVAHHVALHSLKKLHKLNLSGFIGRQISAPREVMGLKFDNPVGLAAGLGKNQV